MTARDLLRAEGTGRIVREVDLPEEAISPVTEGVVSPKTDGMVAPEPKGSKVAVINARPTEPPVENEHPYRSAIHHYQSRKFLARLWRTLYVKFIKREVSKEEMQKRSEMARRQAEKKMLARESKDFRKRFSTAMEIQGLISTTRKGKIRRVRFAWSKANLDAHYIKVDLLHRPAGVGVAKLVDSDLLKDLTMCCGHRVSVEYDERRGVVYRIDRGDSRSGVPAHVMITDMWDRYPDSADGLTLCFGLSTNTKTIYRSISNMPHMLIGGTTGGGKSTGLNAIICTLIMRNAPERLRLMLVDLKRVEFDSYIGIPHLLNLEGITDKGIIKDRAQVTPALEWLLNEVERRYKLLEESGDRKIEYYNQHHRRHALNRIILVIDEWASIRLEKKMGDEAEHILTQIAEIGRAVGVHLIVATQTPNSQVLSTRIRNVLPAKLAYSCSNVEGSKAILGNGHAHNLFPPGRAILDFIRETEVQMPNINDTTINNVVTGVLTGKFVSEQVKHDVTPEEIMRFALDNEDGRLPLHRLFGAFRERGLSRDELAEWLEEWEGQEFFVGDLLYRVEPNSGPTPRRLIAVEASVEVDGSMEGLIDVTNADDGDKSS